MKTKTHLLRVKPPWRLITDQTRCGRLLTACMTVIQPDKNAADRASADWTRRFQVITRRGRSSEITRVRRGPSGICVPCWENLGAYGHQEWRQDPLAVLAVDLAAKNGTRRRDLSRELIALADLVAAHEDEFADFMVREDLLAALMTS